MIDLVEFGIWAYSYCTDFCINASYLFGIDYVTIGNIFFGLFMNGLIVLLIILNKIVMIKRRKLNSL